MLFNRKALKQERHNTGIGEDMSGKYYQKEKKWQRPCQTS